MFKKIFIFLISSLSFILHSFGQGKAIYVGIEGGRNKFFTFVEIQNEIAKVEVLNKSKSGVVLKLYEEKIPKGSDTFSPYKSERISINADITKISIITTKSNVETKRTIELNPYLDSSVQVLDAERNKAYFTERTSKDLMYLDSVIGKGNFFETEYYSALEAYRSDDKDASLNHTNFKDSLNKISTIALNKIIKRDKPYVDFLKTNHEKTNYSAEEIELFLKKATFTKIGETTLLVEIIEKSTGEFLNYLETSKFLTNRKNTLIRELKDISFSKQKLIFHHRIKHALSKSDIHNGSKRKIKRTLRKAKVKRIVYRTVPIIGYGIAIYLIISYI